MNEKYEIHHLKDNEYVVYEKDDQEGDTLFSGTLEQVNAWISLKEKGFSF